LNLRARHPKAYELSQALYFFTRFYLTDDILVKVDRACMQVSLESRAVFLDNDLVAFCQRLPNHFKYRHGQRKYLLRKALEGWIPERILNLPKKGFGIPLNRWLRKMPNTPPFHFLNQSNVERYQTAHHKRRGDYRLFLWSLQVLAALGVG
ncbi:MAG: asparagine synthetase B, partial [Desulfovibrio sp.]|nr:asparagine synthetase B [Desulfovibrio sp.]